MIFFVLLSIDILNGIHTLIILPHFNYGLTTLEHDNTRLHKLQKRAIRTITNSKYNPHTEPVCQQLNIIKLPDIYKLGTIIFFYKIENEQVPNYFTTVINPLNHHYNTQLHLHNITAYSI